MTEDVITRIRDLIVKEVDVFHPIDRIDVYRGISDWARDRAKYQQDFNDKYGVPERQNADQNRG